MPPKGAARAAKTAAKPKQQRTTRSPTPKAKQASQAKSSPRSRSPMWKTPTKETAAKFFSNCGMKTTQNQPTDTKTSEATPATQTTSDANLFQPPATTESPAILELPESECDQDQAQPYSVASLVKPVKPAQHDIMDGSCENAKSEKPEPEKPKPNSEVREQEPPQLPRPEECFTKSSDQLAKPSSAEANSSCVDTHAAICQRERMQKVEHLMNWPAELLHAMFAEQDTCNIGYTYQGFLQHLRGCADGIRVSTAFSGVDTPATAMELISLALSNELGMPLQDRAIIRNTFGVEWFSKSQTELLRHPCGPEHLFGDMNCFWTDTMKHKIDAIMSQGHFVDVMKELISKSDIKSLVRTHAYCLKCGSVCEAPWNNRVA